MTGACGVPGGIATLNLNILHVLIALFREKKIGLSIFSYLEEERNRPHFLPPSIPFKPFKGNKLKLSLSLLKHVRNKPIFFFDHVRLSLPLLPFAATNLVKTIILAHGSESWRRIKKTSKLSFKHATLCITNSYYTLRKMQGRISRFNGVACPLGLSPEFPLNWNIPGPLKKPPILKAVDGKEYALGNRVLLLVARLHPDEREKGHYQLLKILPLLLKKYPDVQLVFPGPGDDWINIKKIAQKLNVASSVFLPGYLPVDKLRELYRHCYAYVMPSKQEGFGLTYLEAMNYAKPCIGCYDQGAEDIIIHNKTGYLVHNPDNRKELFATLDMLLKDGQNAENMGKEGFMRLHAYFTAKHYQLRLKKQLENIL